MPKRTGGARHERTIRQIRLRIKARGCTASGRTASYFYIISTWRSRYYVLALSPVPPPPPPPVLVTFFPPKACGIFGNRCNPFRQPLCPAVYHVSWRRATLYVQAEAWLRFSLSLSFSLSHPRFVKAHCVAVYTRSKRFLS